MKSKLYNWVDERFKISPLIDFMKHNGRQSRKLFKISELNCSEQKKKITKKYSFKPISTRKYYVGIHGIAIVVNGLELINNEFQLDERS